MSRRQLDTKRIARDAPAPPVVRLHLMQKRAEALVQLGPHGLKSSWCGPPERRHPNGWR